MKLIFKVVLILTPIICLLCMFAYLRQQDISFYSYMQRIQSQDFTYVSNMEKYLRELVEYLQPDKFDFNSILSLIYSYNAIPFVFLAYLGCLFVACVQVIGLLFVV